MVYLNQARTQPAERRSGSNPEALPFVVQSPQPETPEKGRAAMNNSTAENQTQNKPFRIIAPDGSLLDTFTVPEESDGMTLFIERPGIQPPGKDKYLERAALAFYNAFEETLEQLREIAPAAAANIEEQLFLPDE